MALIKCKECKKEISTEAKTCPSCGAKNGIGFFKKVGYFFLFLFMLGIFANIFSSKPNKSSSTTATASATQETSAPPPQKSPEEIKKILSGLRKNVDKMEGITWYYTHPQHDLPSKKVEAYMAEKDGRYWLRIKMMYEADTWLFVKSIKFMIDDVPLEYKFGLSDVKRDNTAGRVWEWVDLYVEPEHYALLKMIAKGKKRQMRYNGQQYYDDRTIGEAERKSIAKILDLFEALGGVVK